MTKALNPIVKRLYVDERLSAAEVAERLGKTFPGVRQMLSRACVQLRAEDLAAYNALHPAQHGGNWDEAKVDILRKLWAEGVSASDIGIKLGGVSRSAVIGKAHRLKLKQHSHVTHVLNARAARGGMSRDEFRQRQRDDARRPQAPPAAVTKPERLPKREPEPETTAAPAFAPSNPKILADLTPVCCRWPIGPTPEPGDCDQMLFCAEVAKPGSAYCAHHDKRAWAKRRTPQQKAADEARRDAMRKVHGEVGRNGSVFRSRRAA